VQAAGAVRNYYQSIINLISDSEIEAALSSIDQDESKFTTVMSTEMIQFPTSEDTLSMVDRDETEVPTQNNVAMETKAENEDITIWKEHAHMTSKDESIEEPMIWEYDKGTDDEPSLIRRRWTKEWDVELRADDPVDDSVHRDQYEVDDDNKASLSPSSTSEDQPSLPISSTVHNTFGCIMSPLYIPGFFRHNLDLADAGNK